MIEDRPGSLDLGLEDTKSHFTEPGITVLFVQPLEQRGDQPGVVARAVHDDVPGVRIPRVFDVVLQSSEAKIGKDSDVFDHFRAALVLEHRREPRDLGHRLDLFEEGVTLVAAGLDLFRALSVDRIFFSGDSGYFDGFKEIGKKLGPFDVTFLECGAYNKQWSKVHMFPEQTVQAFFDLGGKVLQPIHLATFNLALHSWYEPMERLTNEAGRKKAIVSTPIMGQVVNYEEPTSVNHWWMPAMKRSRTQNVHYFTFFSS